MIPVNFNGQVFPARTPLLGSNNRGFNFGDGIFETMRIHKGQILFFHKHWERLTQSMQQLGMTWSEDFSAEDFRLECLKIYPNKGDLRLRATIWRAGEGLYTPITNHVNFIITGNLLDTSPYPFHEEGLTIDIFSKFPLSNHAYSWIKSTNCAPYIQAGLFKKHNALDDCLLVNASGNIVEASSANLFLIKESTLVTPPLTEGGVKGIIRTVILEQARAFGFTSMEQPITETDLLQAEEIIFTNSIQGIRWVKKFKNTIFAFNKAKLLAGQLSVLAKNTKEI